MYAHGASASGDAVQAALTALVDAVAIDYAARRAPAVRAELIGPERFGARLRLLCTRERLPLDVLAGILGVSPNTLRLWLNGTQFPRYERLLAIIKYFRVTPNWLMTGEA